MSSSKLANSIQEVYANDYIFGLSWCCRIAFSC